MARMRSERGLVADVAAERVARIGRIDDDPAAAQHLDRLPDEATLGRYRDEVADRCSCFAGYDTRMNQLLEWSPLIVFFLVFKLFGIVLGHRLADAHVQRGACSRIGCAPGELQDHARRSRSRSR